MILGDQHELINTEVCDSYNLRIASPQWHIQDLHKRHRNLLSQFQLYTGSALGRCSSKALIPTSKMSTLHYFSSSDGLLHYCFFEKILFAHMHKFFLQNGIT